MTSQISGERRYRCSAVVVSKNKILVFRAVDPASGREYMFLPGGKIEEGEDPAAAATRECLEETGYKIVVDTGSKFESHYPFFWNAVNYHSHTVFFRASLADENAKPSPVDDADYNKGALWLPVNEINRHFSYTQEILEAVKLLSK